MGECIELDDGLVLGVLGHPVQGTRHEVLLGQLQSGENVVVKIERIEGSLSTEHRALAWLSAHDGPAPKLRAASNATFDNQRVFCLITDMANGQVPTSLAAWTRMGRALASLSQIEWDSIDLPILDAVTFGQLHAQRIGELAGHLDPLRDVIADWDQLCSAQTPGGGGRLVLTHGDPGPGNYLDDGDGGTLIDWEESHVAPMGLDLARAVFIALLGVGPAGYVGRDHQQRARAVTRGYLDRIYDEWLPTPEESRWWLAVAGVQFIHRRWERAGRGGVPPWQEALLTLKNALGSRQPY